MNKYYIKQKKAGLFWTGSSWTSVISFAETYSFDDGFAVVEKRWPRGVRKLSDAGNPFFIEKPVLAESRSLVVCV